MAVSDVTLRDWLATVKGRVEECGLRLSPAAFNAAATPKGLIDLSFVLDLQSRDTQKYRTGSDEMVRIEHTLTVSFAKIVKPADQFDSQLAALDTEEKIIAVLVDRAQMPYTLARWVGTKRALTSSREHIITDITFALEHDWSFSQLGAA